jgi:hypothetical protein
MVNIFATLDEWKNELIKLVGETLVRHNVLIFSLPEYFIDSMVQRIAPITDPFLVAIGPEQNRAEVPSAFSLAGTSGQFWKFGFETQTSFSINSVMQNPILETPSFYAFFAMNPLPETNSTFTFSTVGP